MASVQDLYCTGGRTFIGLNNKYIKPIDKTVHLQIFIFTHKEPYACVYGNEYIH